MSEIPYMMANTPEEAERVRLLAARRHDEEVAALRARLGVTCDCLGPPHYACPHWPAATDVEERTAG